ncbi:MAG: ADP-ribosylglycohydrolase family protein [Chloroflexota bacterium]
MNLIPSQLKLAFALCSFFFIAGCQPQLVLNPAAYEDKIHGAWQAIMVANHTGLVHEGLYLDSPSSENSIELVLLEEWSTDDDTMVEWVYLHVLEVHGLEPSYEQIRDEWIDHINHDIWVSARAARDLMDEGVVPPETSNPDLNPKGVWSIGAQLQTELFGLLAPGMPAIAQENARKFARVTNSGLSVEASAFYVHMYAQAFFEPDIEKLMNSAQQSFDEDSEIYSIVENVKTWSANSPDDWRPVREQIRLEYDHDPDWTASKVNFASTIMSLIYGQGDMMETITIAALAGWDADNNMTTAAGLLGIISGFEGLPEPIKTSSDVYFNEDGTGDLPKYDSVRNIARRTAVLGLKTVEQYSEITVTGP